MVKVYKIVTATMAAVVATAEREWFALLVRIDFIDDDETSTALTAHIYHHSIIRRTRLGQSFESSA